MRGSLKRVRTSRRRVDSGQVFVAAFCRQQILLFKLGDAAFVSADHSVATHGTPAALVDLPNWPLIHEESHRQWTDWFEAAGVGASQRLHGPRLWDASLGLDAARASQGIALGSRILAEDDLASGRLAELFATDIRLGGYYVVSAPSAAATPPPTG